MITATIKIILHIGRPGCPAEYKRDLYLLRDGRTHGFAPRKGGPAHLFCILRMCPGHILIYELDF